MVFFKNKCPACGAVVKPDAAFCPNCGAVAARGERPCPHCASPNQGAANFCVKCGKTMDLSTGRGALWARHPGDLATKIAITPANLFAHRNLTVEHGARALVFADGRLVHELGPGSYDLGPEPPPNTLAHDTWVFLRDLLVQLGIVKGKRVRQIVATALLVDEGDLDLKFDAIALTRDPIKIAVEIRVVLALNDPANLFTHLMKGRANYTLDDLRGDLFDELQNALAEALARRTAFELNSNLELKDRIAEEVRLHLARSLGRYGLEFKQVRAVTFRHQVLDEQQRVKEELLLQTTEREAKTAGRRRLFDALNEAEIQQIAQHTRQIENRELKLRHLQRLRRMALNNRIDELRVEFDKRKAQLATNAEFRELVAAFSERRDDHDHARRRLIERLDLEHELALKVLKGELSEKDAEQERSRRLAAARTAADVAELERDAKIKTAHAALDLRQRKTALESDAEQQRIAREQHAKDREARRDLDRIKALSDVEQARLAADLRKSDSMKHLSEAQIMALMADKSPHVAAAIAERYKAEAQVAASGEMKDVYEKLLAHKTGEADRVERLAGKMLDAVKDVAAARAAPGAPTTPAAQPGILCPTCRRQVVAGAKFCDNCGHQFFE